MDMKKIMIIGSPGAGKTTFARALSRRVGIPLYHLDAIWHRPNRTHISREAFDEELAHILSAPPGSSTAITTEPSCRACWPPIRSFCSTCRSRSALAG